MKMKGIEKITRNILHGLSEEIEDRYENFYVSFHYTSGDLFYGGRIFIIPHPLTKETIVDV